MNESEEKAQKIATITTELRGLGVPESLIEDLLKMSKEEAMELAGMLQELQRQLQAGNRPEAV